MTSDTENTDRTPPEKVPSVATMDIDVRDTDNEDTRHAGPCVECKQLRPEVDWVETTNMSIQQAGNRLYIEPVCDDHDTYTPGKIIRLGLKYDGIGFIEACINKGVMSKDVAQKILADFRERGVVAEDCQLD